MSLNMKAGHASPVDNAPFDRKSDLIKSEIAKYRMLKSKGIIDSNEDIKENRSGVKGATPQLPSYQEGTFRAALALVQSNNSPQAVNANNSTMKSEYWASSSKKIQIQASQSFYSSLQPTAESYRGSASQRDRNANENHAPHYQTPLVKDSQNITNMASLRNSAAMRSPEGIDKKMTNRRSLVSDEKQKEKAMSQIEQFVNSEIEKDEKVYSKTFRHGQNHSTVSKSQAKILKKVPSTGEIRVSSALEMNNRNSREAKNFTPVEETKRKKSLPGSPKTLFNKDRKKNGPSSVAQVDRERKTENLRTVSPRIVLPTKAEGEEDNVVQEEIEKWRIFGKMMAESYDELNKKYTEYMKEKEKDRKVIGALKDQVNTLKSLLKEAKEENLKQRELSSKSTSDSSVKDDKEIAAVMKEIEGVKEENTEIKKMVEFLKEENFVLQKTLEENQKYKDLADHYQKIADTRFKECSALAEEIICLRTDLDRSHSNYLRIQREQTSAQKPAHDTFFSGKKLRQFGEPLSAVKFKKWTENTDKKVNWTEEGDDQPPTPADFNVLPLKEENVFVRG